MSDLFDGMTLDQFREKELKEAKARHQAQLRLKAEQQERILMEKEAARKLPHEEMQDSIHDMSNMVRALEPGSPHAVSSMRSCLMQLLDVVAYILDITGNAERRDD